MKLSFLQKDACIAIGLMSGTSADGIDAAVVELGEDMMSVVPGTLQNLRETDGSGLTGFRESVTVEKVGDLYHFLWSQDDTGSPNYCVQYGVSTSPTGPVQYKYQIGRAHV